MNWNAIVRRFPALSVLSEASQALRLTGQLSLATAQVEGEGCEESRAGRRFWFGADSTSTGVAGVTAIPTTAAQWVFWNADSKNSCAFDALGMYNFSGNLTTAQATLFAALFTAPISNGPSVTGLRIFSMSNGSLQANKQFLVSAITVSTPATPTWVPIAKSLDNGVTASTGLANVFNDNLKGRLLVPPNTGLALSMLSSATATWTPFGWFVLKPLDTE